MPVWTIPSDQIIDYSPNGDDVDSFSQKVKFCIENIFECLQHLHANGATAGLDGEATPFEIRVNTADGFIYMRDKDNKQWFVLGEVANYFGLTPEILSAVRNGGGMGRLMMGSELALPNQGNSTGDLYFAQDTSKIFLWTGTQWRNYIADSTNKIGNINVDLTGLSNGQVLQYDVVRNSFVPVKKDVFTEADVTTTGTANKLVRVGVDGLIHADIKGSATEIANVPVDLTGIKTGDVLTYVGGEFVPIRKDKFDDESTTTTGEANKLVKVGEDGLIHASITGSAQEICSIPVNIKDIDDGQVLRYHSSTKDFRNEDPSAVVGAGKSLILRDGDRVLGDYNGSETVIVDIQSVLSQSMIATDVAHVMRLTENLYLAMEAAGVNPGGYDGLTGETFYGDTADFDMTSANVVFVTPGDDTIDVDTIEGLVEGAHYVLSDGTRAETIQVKHIVVENGINHLILYKAVTNAFAVTQAKIMRSTCSITEGAMSGDGAVCVSNLIPFANEMTGDTTNIRRAHLVVKHQNVADAEISAEIALRDGAKFVKGEVIGIGNGSMQTVSLEHTDDVTAYKFALYFDGVLQTSGFELSPILGQVTFNAANGVIVAADYYYDWSAENFVEMTKTGTYPDRRDQSHATTEFNYDGAAGTVATIRLTLKRGEGTATNEIISAGTGKPRGFRLKHQAIANTVSVSPTPTSKSFNSAQNTVIVTSPVGRAIQISYRWKGQAFSVNSFACTFNE